METALVTGASAGFGKEIARHLAKEGYRVVGTSRSAPASPVIAPEGVTMARLDVCDDASVYELYALLRDSAALPDLIVLNAGVGISGAVEETSMELVRQQMETNFFGVHRVVSSFLPQMRENRRGQLIVIGSMAAQVTIPFQGFYSASKAAISSYTEGLRMETAVFGLNVSLIEPGDHKSDFGANRIFGVPSEQSCYQPQCDHAVSVMEESELDGPPSSDVAELVVKIAKSKAPKFRYMQIQTSERIVLALRRLLPLRMFERIIMSHFGLPRE